MDDMNYNLVMMAIRDLKDSNDKLHKTAEELHGAVRNQGDTIEKLAQVLSQPLQGAAADRTNQVERVQKLEDDVAKLKEAS